MTITTPEQMREAAALMIEATAYTSNGDTRSLEPVSSGLVGMDMHHATIAAAIRAIPIAPQPVADDFDGLQNKMLDMIEANIDTMKLALETAGERIAELEAELAACKTQPVAVTVKPLVWGTERMISGDYRIHATLGQNSRPLMLSRGSYIIEYGDTEAELQIKAQADYEARILSALTTHPADPLSDPRVKALVEAARCYEDQLCEGFCADMPDKSLTNSAMENDCGGCKARAALRAIGGEA